METWNGVVLAHDPRVCVANFFYGVARKAHQLWIPAAHTGVVTGHALTNLDQRMLDVARLLLVPQVLGQLLVGKMAAEPRVPPEQEGHQHHQPGSKKKQKSLPRRHAMTL